MSEHSPQPSDPTGRRERSRAAASGDDERSYSSRFSRVVLALIVAPPVLFVGGVHPEVQLGLLGYYTLLFAIVALRGWQRGRSLLWHPLVGAAALLGLVAALQAVAWPIEWIEVISPHAAEATRAIDAAFGAVTHRAALSLDLDASRAAAVRWWAMGLALWTALQCLRGRRARRAVPWLVMGLGIGVVAIGLVQFVTEPEAVYGLYTPRQAAAQVGQAGPFINPNHAGQFLLLAAMSSLVLLARPNTRKRQRTWPLVALYVLFTAGIFANGVRGALAALLLGVVLVVLLRPRRRRYAGRGAAATAVALSLAVAGLLAMRVEPVRSFLDLQSLRQQLGVDKLVIQRHALDLATDFPLTGLGADAFGATQVALMPMPRPAHLSFVENDFLQLLLDFGIVVTVFLFVALALTRRGPARRKRRVWWAAFVAFAAASTVNFAAAALGLMVPVLVLFAATLGRSRRLGRSAAAWMVAVAAALALGGILAVGHPTISARDAPPATLDDLRAALERAPLNGRAVWEQTVGALEAGTLDLDSDVVAALADRAEQLAGNDGPLLMGLSRYWLERGDHRRAWQALARAAGEAGLPAGRLTSWLARVDDIRELEVGLARHDVLRPPVLNALAGAERHADILLVALALPDDPYVVYWRIRASHNLGEPALARGFAGQLASLPDTEADDCYWRASGHYYAGQIETALAVMADCIEKAPSDLARVERFLDWSFQRHSMALSVREQADGYLSELNLRTLGDGRRRWRYHRYVALARARDDQCDAAELALSQARGELGRSPRLPPWAVERCPVLGE